MKRKILIVVTVLMIAGFVQAQHPHQHHPTDTTKKVAPQNAGIKPVRDHWQDATHITFGVATLGV